MIQRVPGYNLSRDRRAVRTATGLEMRVSTSLSKGFRRTLPCLSRLCDEIGALSVRGTLVVPISDLCLDSRRAAPGALFFALPGEQTDGSFFIEEAIERGAVAIVSERPGLSHPRATFIQVADARAAMAIVSRRFFGFTPGQPALIGLTGSHGKTSVSHLLKHLLCNEREQVGLFSSIHYDLGSRVVPSYLSTPEAVDLYGMLSQVRENGCGRAVIEVSSHGIEQKRVLGLPLDVAVFLNHGDEHADCDGGRKGCFLAKSGILTGSSSPVPRVAVVNLDDPYGRRLIRMIPNATRVITFGFCDRADIRATEIAEGEAGAVLRIVWPEGSARVRIRQVGKFAVSNALAAVAAAYAAGSDLNLALSRLLSFAGVPGRMERIDEGQPFDLIVDSARTPEAVRHALLSARELCDGRLLVVFGCCGERNRRLRPRLVAAVQEKADFSWATADNPRNEPLAQIFDDMRTGIAAEERIAFVTERRRAIESALYAALPGDLVLVLGKGEEPFQYVGDAALPFDDRLVSRELLALREVAVNGF